MLHGLLTIKKKAHLKKKYFAAKCGTYQKVIAQAIFSNTVIVSQFCNKVIVLWPIAHHRFAPFSIVRAGTSVLSCHEY